MAKARDRRGGGGARCGSSAVLWAVGAAFALYVVFLLRLHGWAQQETSASNRVGGGDSAPSTPKAVADGAKARALAARVLERAARAQTQTQADKKGAYLRPGATERAAATEAPEATTRAETKAPTQLPIVTIVEPATRPSAAPIETAAVAAQTAAATQAAALQAPGDALGLEADVPKEPAALQPDAPSVTSAPPPLPTAGQEDRLMDAAVVPPPVVPTTAPPATEVHVPFQERHEVVAGYDKLLAFLEGYMAPPGESLFLFFVCSDQRFRPDDWSPECVAAKQHVYSVFAASPARNRLVTVLAGSERYWKFQNDFYNDPDLRVKGVPCLMKWEGAGGRTSGMMVLESLQYDVFLRYLFGNEDQPDPYLTPAAVAGKQIVTVKGYDAYLEAMAAIKREPSPVTTFMIAVSGRFKTNNRPWCPYCRYSELPVEYAFYAFAPPRARLVRVEVTSSYTEWKRPNRFNRDPELDMHVVPALYKLRITPPADAADKPSVGSIVYERHKVRLDLLESLRAVFSQ